MTLFILKGCPRCGGDLYLGEDGFGKFMSCIQCGFLRDLQNLQINPEFEVVSKQEGSGKTPGHNPGYFPEGGGYQRL